jgi:hypothetical protein
MSTLIKPNTNTNTNQNQNTSNNNKTNFELALEGNFISLPKDEWKDVVLGTKTEAAKNGQILQRQSKFSPEPVLKAEFKARYPLDEATRTLQLTRKQGSSLFKHLDNEHNVYSVRKTGEGMKTELEVKPLSDEDLIKRYGTDSV